MQKINSIGYGDKVIGAGVILAFGIPIAIRIFGFKIHILHIISNVSFSIGCLILFGFLLLLLIELHQDKKLNQYYDKNKRQKIKIGENLYECQVCSNRNIRPEDEYCSVCGTHFVVDKKYKQDESVN